jgi:hypothetical protein
MPGTKKKLIIIPGELEVTVGEESLQRVSTNLLKCDNLLLHYHALSLKLHLH